MAAYGNLATVCKTYERHFGWFRKDIRAVTVGEAAKLSGLMAKTICYYEDIALIAPDRASN
ncbi:hypothetical protein GA830_05760 [Mesorhizobium sp. NBSH29]|uniref:MerR family DNA-binding transcriptional regulator n=1 Tax=Mesorhizobium sp. NBSH29 TaxID=2654249 RepID=UPI001896580C|nr:MerR family DNA-binding transcriptional regulator [Mesorhizobium sp. NBSH29]QPC86298.1 hypothetical protein GA830_05760 [Mesorhizobium sp. NBSH29]